MILNASAFFFFFFFFFDSAKEASSDGKTYLTMRFIKKQKPAVFWENITS